MMLGYIPLLQLSFVFQAPKSLAQSTQTFCNRLYHSSIIANNTLYVDGGELRQSGKSGVQASLPSTVDTIDLTKPWANTDTSIWGHISKNVTGSGLGPQSLNDGSIFSDNSSLFLYGGALSMAPGAPKVPPPNEVWQYDMATDQWTNITTRGDPVQRLHFGIYVQSSTGEGYYLGGAKTPKSDATFLALEGATPYMVEGLLTFNESSLAFQNGSTSGLNEAGTEAGGFLVLIESLGQRGVLVTFGGVSNTAGVPMSLGDNNFRDPSLHLDFAQISIYDISNQQWYRQNATGDIPPWRYDGCAVVVSAPDQSSHSIYVFGGWAGTTASSNGFVYVLSLPSFRWIRVTEDRDLRQRHNCHLMGAHTMLVIGGIKPGFDNLQPPDITGCDTSAKFRQGLGIFSLNNHSWTTSYDPSIGAVPYSIHPKIANVIGGNANGGATLQTPVAGFSQKSLGNLLGARPEPNNSTSQPTASAVPRPQILSTRAIIGIVVGGVIVVGGFVGGLVFLLLSRRRKQPKPWPPSISTPIVTVMPPQMKYYSELDANFQPPELRAGSQCNIYENKSSARELTGESPGEKSLPSRPSHEKKEIHIHEMEAWSPMSERSEPKL